MFKRVAEMSIDERAATLRNVSSFLNDFSVEHHELDRFWNTFTMPANVQVIALENEYSAWIELQKTGNGDLNGCQNTEALKQQKFAISPIK